MQNWTDLNVDGRRLNKIIRDMNSKLHKETLDDLTRLAYIDRLIKATHEKSQLAQLILEVKDILKQAQKIHA